MNAIFPVDWRRHFKPLTLFMSVAIIAALTVSMIGRYALSGFSYSKTFEHVSLPVFLLILVCTPVFSAVCSFLMALWFRLATVTITDGMIHGRDFWGLKNRIPLHDMTKLTAYSDYGIKAIVVNSKHHGQIYISDKTRRLSELLAVLNQHLPGDGKIMNAEQIAGENRLPPVSQL